MLITDELYNQYPVSCYQYFFYMVRKATEKIRNNEAYLTKRFKKYFSLFVVLLKSG